jgi:hypothetical protein
MSTLPKLYVVRVKYAAYVLAVNEEEARSLDSEILQWEDPSTEVSSGAERLAGWDDDPYSLVYHTGHQDISLLKARKEYEVGEP